MKAETVISDLLMKCEEENVKLPENPWEALREVIVALRNTKHQGLGYLQIPRAFDHLESKFADSEEAETPAPAAATASPQVPQQRRTLMQDMPKRKQRSLMLESDSDSGDDNNSASQTGLTNAMSPVASSKKKTKYPKKTRIQEQVEATPATKGENQSLVDQLVQLGEFEVTHGHSQRGMARFRAAKEIRDSNIVITSGAQARRLDRVGQSAATKVDQLLNEGIAAALSEYDVDDEALPVTK
ncbi:hypothetical protein PHMEG_000958 [Phytophthora megakarya]|uniref:Crossover junction endonuclease MUS81-like HHH domain-containing protein n=1 Tax=Phytophthora megakarya TaxID=4795 RepID=A0A225X3Y3_9STRA|nr:hypothetical protein PHMEG_000958 [Phytophthora megakarya]